MNPRRAARSDARGAPLPAPFRRWFGTRGWTPRAHQIALLEAARQNQATLLIAPTGAGKTLAGFLPSLVRLSDGAAARQNDGLDTLYISPLKALAVDVARNLDAPVAEIGLSIRVESRTGDTTAARKRRQRARPPHILLTTPEQLALLLTHAGAPHFFRGLRTVILDELHALVASKRGDLLALSLSRLNTLAPGLMTLGLSATVARPSELRAYLMSQPAPGERIDLARMVVADGGATAEIRILGLDATPAVFAGERGQKTTDVGIPPTRALPTRGRGCVEQGSTRARTGDGVSRRLSLDATPSPLAGEGWGGGESQRPGEVSPNFDPRETTELRLPWGGHSARYAIPAIAAAIQRHRLTLVFVNTRMQAELVFQELWRANEDGLAIALHHGSLDADQRRKVEAAMAAGTLRAVVCTSTLDLGVDWGDVDLVVNVGAPKGASRLMQRIGRSNHRLDEPSRALLVPAYLFEALECQAARDAAEAGEQDTPVSRPGGLDVLAQHLLGMACQGPFAPNALFEEVRSALPYAGLGRETFDRLVDFVATGGYALRAYENFAKLRPTGDGRMRLSHPRLAQRHRMNAGTIVESPMIKVRMARGGGKIRKPSSFSAAVQDSPHPIPPHPLAPRHPSPLAGEVRRGGIPPMDFGFSNAAIPERQSRRAFLGGRVLGEIEEDFIGQLAPGAAFVFAGEVLRFEGMIDTEAFVTRAAATDPVIPSYAGGKFPLSTHLAARVRALLADRTAWRRLPAQVRAWLDLQSERSAVPSADEVLVETFPRALRHYLVAYPFEGRLAHQTLGMLLTRRLERAGARPLGFVANDYGLAVWHLENFDAMMRDGRVDLDELFSQDMLGGDLDAWLASSSLMKRTFRNVAVIAGLIERRHPGHKKSGRQVTMSTDLVYDVLRRHDPGHILLEAAKADAAAGLLDLERLADFLPRIAGRIMHRSLERVSPLSVPILLEIGREPAPGAVREDMLRDAARALIAEAVGDQHARTQARAHERG